MPRNDDPVEVNMVFIATPMMREIHILEDAERRQVTLPKSQVTLAPEFPDKHDDVTVTMPEWLAIDRGLV